MISIHTHSQSNFCFFIAAILILSFSPSPQAQTFDDTDIVHHKQWDFAEEGNLMGWQPQNIAGIGVQDDVLMGMSETNDPLVQIVMRDGALVNDVMGVAVRFRTSDPTKCQVFVGTSAEGGEFIHLGNFDSPGPEHGIIFAPLPDDLYDGATINRVRFDPSVHQGIEFEIDWISLVSVETERPTPTETPKATSTETPTLTPTATGEPQKQCVYVDDIHNESGIEVEQVVLGPAAISQPGPQELLLLDIRQCPVADRLGAFIDFSPGPDADEPKALVQLLNTECGGEWPKEVTLIMSHITPVTLHAYDPSHNLLKTREVEPQGDVTETTFSSSDGLGTIYIEGSEICILGVCWKCEAEPEPTPTPVAHIASG